MINRAHLHFIRHWGHIGPWHGMDTHRGPCPPLWSLELWKTGGALIRLAMSIGSVGQSCTQKNECFYTCFPITSAQDSPRLWNSPSKVGMRGERSQTRRDREAKSWKRHYRESIRERWREMGGGRSLYFSAPFGSFIPQRLGFIGGSFNNKGSAFEMKLSCVCVGEPLFFFILRW